MTGTIGAPIVNAQTPDRSKETTSPIKHLIVIIGENRTFGGNEELLRSRGVEVEVLDDPRCIALMERFQRDHPDIWAEDIAE